MKNQASIGQILLSAFSRLTLYWMCMQLETLEQHNPAKLGDVHVVAKAHLGKIDILNQRLAAQYKADLTSPALRRGATSQHQAPNNSPSAIAARSQVPSARETCRQNIHSQLTFLYKFANPANVKHVAVLVERHRNDVPALNALLRQKYGVDLSSSEDEIRACKPSARHQRSNTAYAGSSSAGPMPGPPHVEPAITEERTGGQKRESLNASLRSTSAGPMQEPPSEGVPQLQIMNDQYGRVVRKPQRQQTLAGIQDNTLILLKNFYTIHAPERKFESTTPFPRALRFVRG